MSSPDPPRNEFQSRLPLGSSLATQPSSLPEYGRVGLPQGSIPVPATTTLPLASTATLLQASRVGATTLAGPSPRSVFHSTLPCRSIFATKASMRPPNARTGAPQVAKLDPHRYTEWPSVAMPPASSLWLPPRKVFHCKFPLASSAATKTGVVAVCC